MLRKGVAIRSVSPEEAAALLADGYVYVDVRSEPEFEAGHVPGALNVPLLHQGPGGLTPNPEFLSVMQQAFGSAEKMVVGCKAGGRSKKAADQLSKVGFSILPGTHPIVPVMLGDAALAAKVADALLQKGIYVIGFSYPVVPQGKARIRTQISAAHTRQDLEFGVEKFAEVKKELGL